MKTIVQFAHLYLVSVLISAVIVGSASAQEVSIPDPGLNAAIRETLLKPSGTLNTRDLLGLTVLDASSRNVRSTEGLEAARNLISLDLRNNLLTSFSLPSQLTSLANLDLSSNPLTNCFLPDGLTNLTKVNIVKCLLRSLTLPEALTGLTSLDLEDNQFTSFNLSSNLTSLIILDLDFNLMTNFALPSGLTNLATFSIAGNLLTNFTLPAGLTGLTELDLSQNQLNNFVIPAGLSNLSGLFIADNQLINLTLPPDMMQLVELSVFGNPLSSLVLSEPLAATNLAEEVASLNNQNISVFTYPLAARLIGARQAAGEFQFAITGPPGAYTVLASPDLAVWSELSVVTNSLGTIRISDVAAHLSKQKFYRAHSP